jgi:hypothetical protein
MSHALQIQNMRVVNKSFNKSASCTLPLVLRARMLPFNGITTCAQAKNTAACGQHKL